MKRPMLAASALAGTLLVCLFPGSAPCAHQLAREGWAFAAPLSRPPRDAPWDANLQVNDAQGGQRFASHSTPSIAADAAGNVYAVWADERDGHSEIYFSFKSVGDDWAPSQRVNDTDPSDDSDQDRPALAIDPSGGLYAVWHDRRNQYPWPILGEDVYFAYRPPGGDWQPNERVNQEPGTADAHGRPAVAVDADGNAYVVWLDVRNESTTGYHVYFRERASGGEWAANVRVNDSGTSAMGSGWGEPKIAVDPSGNAYAVWTRENFGGISPVCSDYRPAGGNWTTDIAIDDSASGGHADIAVDAAGTVYAVWYGGVDGTIQFAYKTEAGAWAGSGAVGDAASAPYFAGEPSIAVDAIGNAYVVWADERNNVSNWSDPDIYFSFRPAGGDWAPDVRVNDDSTSPWWVKQVLPELSVNPGGDAYAIWLDSRNLEGDHCLSESCQWDVYFSHWLPADADGDGLLDTWEQEGIDVDGDDTVDLDLPGLGADAMHKDIFVEIDYMEHHQPDVDAAQDVIDAFAAAPVSNPDNQEGINLHLLVDDQIPHQDTITMWADFDTIKDAHFGTGAERSSPNAENIRSAKRLAFRYCLFVHQYDLYPSSSGLAEFGGDDFIVSLGAPGWGTDPKGHSVGTRDEQAATFMHELGHTLGLRHGGVDDANCKPNYLSIMSYSRQLSRFLPGRPLDYSRTCLPTLLENDLDEWLGIRGDSSMLTVYADGYGDFRIARGCGAIDWDGDGFMEGESLAGDNVHVNINNLGFPGCDDADSTQALTGYDDWANILYSFRGSANYPEGTHIVVADPEITTEIAEEISQIADFQNVYLPLAVRSR